jgi:hypothetical protein
MQPFDATLTRCKTQCPRWLRARPRQLVCRRSPSTGAVRKPTNGMALMDRVTSSVPSVPSSMP